MHPVRLELPCIPVELRDGKAQRHHSVDEVAPRNLAGSGMNVGVLKRGRETL
ncbi:hypothetical protein BDW74DRAFT_142898 [Aspergillus multicolor]|uniref:uncharacterized protein n=1 Tax=Aspergillus multicolor TaxID=41759 RepID=UPI003CCE1678